MRAVARIKSLPQTVKSVYLLNQDYLFGQSIQKDTKRFLAQYRPDIKIVGDELIPLAGQGFLALHHQDQGVRRAVAAYRQLWPGPQPADQGRRRCRSRHPLRLVPRPS